MSVTEHPGAAACPGCVASPASLPRQNGGLYDGAIQISLPTIHCAGCISTIERGLSAQPDIEDVRINLTRKRASVWAKDGVSADDVAARISALGYEAQPLDTATLTAQDSDRAARDLAMRLGVAGFAMMNVMLLSVAVWSGASDATRDLFHWLSAAIALPTVTFSAQPFFKSAWRAVSAARLNMDVPISLAILLAAGMSLYETINHGEHAYFDAALSLTFFLLGGRYLDQRMRSNARSAAAELAALEAPTALKVMADGTTKTIETKTVEIGDVLLVQPGGKVPVDGVITEGSTELNRAFLTGETDPILAGPGDMVRAGEINLTGAVRLRADAVGQDTLLHGLSDLIAVAETAKSKYNSLADQAARIYAPAVHLLAFIAFGLWLYLTAGDVRIAVNVAVAVLIITCPCALGLAVPAVSTVASGRLYKKGLLLKHGTALERMAEIEEVFFDKTGTLTAGAPRLMNAGSYSENALGVASALAAASGHPRSQAIVAAAAEQGTVPVRIEDIHEVPGYGVEGRWQGKLVRLGRGSWAGAGDIVDGSWLAVEGEPAVRFEFEDVLRPGAEALVKELQGAGVPVTILSGDSQEAVKRIADALGVDDWIGSMLPDEKVAVLEERKHAGRKVLMVGDGLNDTAALATAHVSIAPASALEATRVAADAVLVSRELDRVWDMFVTARSARRRILENFSVAAIYNAIAIPLAFSGIATPLMAAIAMSTSSIIVSVNALRTR